MPTVRYRTAAEVAEDVKSRVAALSAFESANVVTFLGTKFEQIRQAFENTVGVPACIVSYLGVYHRDDAPGSARTSRYLRYRLWILAETFRILEDAHYANAADLVDAVVEQFSPQVGSLATPYTANGCRYHPGDADAIDSDEDFNYDVFALDLDVFDCRQNRDDNGVPV